MRRISCQYNIPEKCKEMFLSDLQTVVFGNLKNTRS
jgi:hypothetical protein